MKKSIITEQSTEAKVVTTLKLMNIDLEQETNKLEISIKEQIITKRGDDDETVMYLDLSYDEVVRLKMKLNEWLFNTQYIKPESES